MRYAAGTADELEGSSLLTRSVDRIGSTFGKRRKLERRNLQLCLVEAKMPRVDNKAACSIVALILVLMAAPTCAADGPVGFQIRCIRTPAECRGGGESVVTATNNVMSTLEAVNSRVNGSMRARRDGAVDAWSVGVSAGDCEDYVLAKRRSLIRAGLPASALRFASVKTRGGEVHAVLVVKTTAGDYVLDNLRKALNPVQETGYRVVSMSTADPRVWS